MKWPQGRRRGIWSIFFSLLYLLFVGTAIAISFWGSVNYAALNNHGVVAEDSVLDLSTTDTHDYSLNYALMGQVDFYYNRLIVSDNDQQPRDTQVNLPCSWSDYGFVKSGYGSYAFTVKGLPQGGRLELWRGHPLASTAFYAQKSGGSFSKLGEVGRVSKTEYVDPPYTQEMGALFGDGGDIRFVIECGYNPFGGLTKSPFYGSFETTKNDMGNRYLAGTGFGLVLANLVFSAILFVSHKKQRGNSAFFILSVAVTIFYMLSLDFAEFMLSLNLSVLPQFLNNLLIDIFGLFCVSTIAFMLFRRHLIPWRTYDWPIATISCTVSLIVFAAVYPTPWACFSMIPWILYLAYLTFRLFLNGDWTRPLWAFTLMSGFFSALYAITLIDTSGAVVFGILSFTSIFVALIGVVLNFIYLYSLRRISEHASKAESNIQLYEEAQQEAMVKQAQPYFLFNSLDLVKGCYHHDITEGDEAIGLLAKTLRTSIDSSSKTFVSFGEELDAITRYVDLQNLGKEKPIDVLYDVSYEGFKVPPLSIEPFVENALKHAKLDEVKEPLIVVRSSVFGEEVTITVIDNGCGFDSHHLTSQNAPGITNAMTRLAYTLNAKVSIRSEISKGTEVSISFLLPSNSGGTQ